MLNLSSLNFLVKSVEFKFLERRLNQLWQLGFDPSVVSIDKVAAWVRFPDISIDFYDKKFLRKFGNEIGKTIKVDKTTTLQASESYARVCVELDLSKPLLSKFSLYGREFFYRI